MDKFEKIAEIRCFEPNATKDVIKTLEKSGFYICFEENYGPDGNEFILMKKATQ